MSLGDCFRYVKAGHKGAGKYAKSLSRKQLKMQARYFYYKYFQ